MPAWGLAELALLLGDDSASSVTTRGPLAVQTMMVEPEPDDAIVTDPSADAAAQA